jgi:hypothetical protein
MAGRLSSVRTPWPWTGAEKVDGSAVEAAAAEVVGAAVIVEAWTDDVVPAPTATASNVEDDTFTPTRGEEEPPTLTPSRAAAVDEATGALLAFEVTIATALLGWEETTTTALLALEETATTTLLALELTIATGVLLAFEETATTALLALEETATTALLALELTIATGVLVFATTTALLDLAELVISRASILSTTGAAATNAPKNVIAAMSFILIDVLERARKRSDRDVGKMPRRTKDEERD